MRHIIFDVETNGLIEEATKVHVLSYTDMGSLDVKSTHDPQEMRDILLGAKTLVGHNICRFDVPVLEKLLGIKIKAKLYDTLPLAWYLDFDRQKHGLETYGDKYKVSKPKIDDWHNLTQEQYAHRCEEDVKINFHLWHDLIKLLMFLYKDKNEADRFLRYLTFKMQCAAHQELVGWHVDLERTQRNVDLLTKLQEEKVEELRKVMPPRQLFKKVKKPKDCFKKDGTPSVYGQRWFSLLDEQGLDRTHEDDLSVPNGTEEPNPNSSDQVKDWLFSLGWEPCTYKYEKEDDGSERRIPQVRKDGELTESVKLLIDENPAVAVLDGLTVIQHRLSIFNGYLESHVNGVLKAQVAGLTNTLRFKHAKPLVNLPGVDKPYGEEVRGCLIAPPGYVLCGADMVSLEDTTKRHYMFPYDPDYVEVMQQPGFDPHLDLAMHAGKVDPDDVKLFVTYKDDKDLGANLYAVIKAVSKVRKQYKAVNYSAIYGVGAMKLSRTVGISVFDATALIAAYWERNWAIKKFSEDQPIRKIGGQMWVQNPVSKFWINLRYEKDVFSSINQSTGVFCFDSWMAQCWIRGLRAIGQFHDEGIWCIPQGSETDTKATMIEAIDAVNDKLQLNVPLGIDAKFGKTYSGVH